MVYPLVYGATRQGIEKEWREQGKHARRLHTFPTAGGGIRCASSADENRDRPKPIGERQKERDSVGKREKRIEISVVAVVAREHHRGREKKRETQAETFVRVFSFLATLG